MDDAYDCEYDMVDNPTEMLEQAHARIRELEAEHSNQIDRLRLTDEEREAIERLEDHCAKTHCVDTARVLRGLLERHGY